MHWMKEKRIKNERKMNFESSNSAVVHTSIDEFSSNCSLPFFLVIFPYSSNIRTRC